MRLEVGGLGYEWDDDWARLPDDASVRNGWAHTAVVVTADGRVVTGHPGEPTLLVLNADGRLLGSADVDAVEVHGITLDGDAVWISDIGRKRRPHDNYANPAGLVRGGVSRVDLNGRTLRRLDPPTLGVYENTSYSPTGTAVDAASGDVWVADGYGASLVHRYDGSGRWVEALSGEEGGGRFNCPHAALVDTRPGDGELYVADRGNGRIQVYGLDGRFRRMVGADFLVSPTNLALDGERLVVAEHRGARLAVLGPDDALLGYLGENGAVADQPGWPNSLDSEGAPTRSRNLAPGRFNSPHGVGVDGNGNIYVAEWLIGGRYVKLARAR